MILCGRKHEKAAKRMNRVPNLLLIIVFLLLLPVSTGTTGPLQVHFIDVGQGDSIFIITPNNKTILIDAGIHSATNDKRNPFNYIRGLKRDEKIKNLNIDVAFITHSHDDHYGGFNYLCRDQGGGQDFAIENLFYSVFHSKAYGKFWPCLESLIRKSIHASQVSARGPPINPDSEIDLKVLYPFQKITKLSQDKNDDSIVLLLQYQKTRFLFTGDASKKVERELLDKDIQSNVLKLGHHGSRTASDEEFLKKVKPSSGDFYIVISSNDKDGKGKTFGHPHRETLETLKKLGKIQLYRTDLHGNIVSNSDGSIINVETQKKEISEEKLWKAGKKSQ
jgi:beta-lactamase superfamily II metal-dependent hydrolase